MRLAMVAAKFSGAEANEAAIKLARKLGDQRGIREPQIVVMEGSFHGRTLGALRVIGSDKHSAPYAALLPPSCRVPFDDLDAASKAVDADTAAFVVEPIQGEGGVNVPRDGYLQGLREICDAAGAVLIRVGARPSRRQRRWSASGAVAA